MPEKTLKACLLAVALISSGFLYLALALDEGGSHRRCHAGSIEALFTSCDTFKESRRW